MLPVMMPRLLTLLDAHHVLTHQTLQQQSIPSLRGHAIQAVVDALNDGLAETEASVSSIVSVRRCQQCIAQSQLF